jgi:hypothetical protein
MSMNTDSRNQTMTSDRASNTIAAIFATDHDAREAIKELHKAGFKKTWLGKTHAADTQTGDTLVEDANGGPIGRFFSGNLTLRRALVSRGVSELQAANVEDSIAVGCSILTAYGEDNPDRAVQILTDFKGDVVGTADALPPAVANASASPRVGVSHDEKREAEKERHEDAKLHRDTATAPQSSDYLEEDDFFERPYPGAGRI